MPTVVSMVTLDSILLRPHTSPSPPPTLLKRRFHDLPPIVPEPEEEEVSNGAPPGEETVVEEPELLDDLVETRSVGDNDHRLLASDNVASSEFYDAPEDFLSDSPASSPLRLNIDAEMATLRIKLMEEVEKRMKLEETLAHEQMKWKSAAADFSKVGLSFPSIPFGQKSQEIDASIAQACQEVVVLRFVSNALGRGLARAEAEASAEEIIKSKNREISRLQDRLQYHEAVNHEMCQRNQEAIMLARQKRVWRRQQQRWMWGILGFSLTLGASYMAYSYLPHFQEASSSPLNQSLDRCLESVESQTD